MSERLTAEREKEIRDGVDGCKNDHDDVGQEYDCEWCLEIKPLLLEIDTQRELLRDYEELERNSVDITKKHRTVLALLARREGEK